MSFQAPFYSVRVTSSGNSYIQEEIPSCYKLQVENNHAYNKLASFNNLISHLEIVVIMNGDPNMETLYEWALEYLGISFMPTNLENDTQKLIEIVDMIGYCIGKEFDKDKTTYKQQHGKDPTPEQEPYIIVLFKDYDTNRKQEFLECIKKCLQGKLSEIAERYQMNFVLKLWSGCLSTAKTLSQKTQSGLNTAETRTNLITWIDSRAATDTIYRKGVEIACIWPPDPKNVCFDGVPHNSSVRNYESRWSKRERVRAIKQSTRENSESN